MVTIKQFIEWIIKTYNILIPYDKTFDYGNEYIERGLCSAQKTRLVDKSTRGLAYFYITQFLIINLYELLNLIHRWKFPQNDPNAVLSDKQFINKLQKKKIDYNDPSNKDAIDKIIKSDIFQPMNLWTSTEKLNNVAKKTFYDILYNARNEIAHADFGLKSRGRYDAMSWFGDILRSLSDVLGIKK